MKSVLKGTEESLCPIAGSSIRQAVFHQTPLAWCRHRLFPLMPTPDDLHNWGLCVTSPSHGPQLHPLGIHSRLVLRDAVLSCF